MLRIFSVAISVSPHVCSVLNLILIFMFLKYCTYELGIFHANQTTMCLRNQGGAEGECWSAAGWSRPTSKFIAGRPKAALLFWFSGDFRCGALLFMVILVIYKY